MEILDSTLREGEQRYGVFFPVPIKVALATELIKIADFVEIGSPRIAPSYEDAAAELVKVVPPDRLIIHCTLDEKCIRSARELGAHWVGLFVAIRKDIHALRYGRRLDQTQATISTLLQLCSTLGLRVRLTCEDASRTPMDELAYFYLAAIQHGVDRIGFADTTGALTPDQAHNYFAALKQAGVPLARMHAHFHNDRGFAHDNTDVAIRHGVACVDGTITGIGERVGITQTEYLASMLSRHTDEALDAARRIVSAYVQFQPVAALRFTHKAGIHVDGVLKYPQAYEWTNPEALGLRRTIVLSKLAGRSAVRYYLRTAGCEGGRRAPDVDSIIFALKRQEFLEIVSVSQFESFLDALLH